MEDSLHGLTAVWSVGRQGLRVGGARYRVGTGYFPATLTPKNDSKSHSGSLSSPGAA